MGYVLWDTDTANSLQSFASEGEALNAVAEIVARYRSRRARRVAWLMLTEESGGATRIVGTGEELAQRALAASSHRAPATPARRKRAAA